VLENSNGSSAHFVVRADWFDRAGGDPVHAAAALSTTLKTNMSVSAFQNLYSKRRWRRMSKAQLQREPLCQECLKKGIITIATVADHVEPHRGDPNKFWLGALSSLCSRCHGATKQQVELHGYSREIGADGMPVDPAHPIYKTRGGE
jgi:5-methylcytosine-specific restriction endonuclease McrA